MGNALIAGIVLIAVVVVAATAAIVINTSNLALSSITTTYNGQFKTGYLAADHGFIAQATEVAACNASVDAGTLGGNSYTSCIYKPTVQYYMNGTYGITNGTTQRFDWVFETKSGNIQSIDINSMLQTGTPANSADIANFKIYTYADTPQPVGFSTVTNDNNNVEVNTGVIPVGKYVIAQDLVFGGVASDTAGGTAWLKMTLDATTDGTVSAARVVLQNK